MEDYNLIMKDYILILRYYDYGNYKLEDVLILLDAKGYNMTIDNIMIEYGKKEDLLNKIIDYKEITFDVYKNSNNIFESFIQECEINELSKKKILELSKSKVNENKFYSKISKSNMFLNRKCKYSMLKSNLLYLCEYQRSFYNSDYDNVKIYKISIKKKI